MVVGRTKVLFIAGSGRSGSTLLDNVLGQLDGYCSGGELRYVWERGLVANRLCGCGRHLRDCQTWHDIFDRAFGGMDQIDGREMVELQRRGTRARHLPKMLLSSCSSRPELLLRRLNDFPDRVARLYHAISTVSGSEVVVDSSKLPAYGYVLGRIPSIDLFVVHLVRDPRAAAYSWSRRKLQPDRGSVGYMERQSPLKSSLLWDLWNVTSEVMWAGRPQRYLRLHYEDFVERPRESVARILALVGDDRQVPGFLDERSAELRTNHSAAGNPNRLSSGVVALRLDTQWMERMPAMTRAAVTAVTAPLLLRYGYSPWRPTAPPLIEDERPFVRMVRRVVRQLRRARAHGTLCLVEGDQLNPWLRISRRLDRWRWRRSHGARSGEATPVYLVGVQRSGTNMIVRAFEASLEFEVHNENDRKVFARYQLRSDDHIRSIVGASRHRFVLFKPLADSHRVGHLLDHVLMGRPGRAIWAYRSVDDRVRSALAKFGDANLRVLSDIAAGGGAGRWQAQRLSRESLSLVGSFDYDRLSAASGAALFWYVRNALYFELALHQRDDVTLISYGSLIEDPARAMRGLCTFVGCGFDLGMTGHISARPTSGSGPVDLDPRVRSCCDELEERLDAAAREKAVRQTS